MGVYDKPILEGIPVTPEVRELLERSNPNEQNQIIALLQYSRIPAHFDRVRRYLVRFAERKCIAEPSTFVTALLTSIEGQKP